MAINFLNTLQFSNNESLNFRLQNLGTDPTTDLQEGRLYYHDTDDVVKVYTIDAGGNGAWVEVGGGVTSVGASIDGDAVAISNSPITSSGTIAFNFQGDATEYVNGEGDLVSFPTIPSVPTNIVETFSNSNGTYVSATTENSSATGDVTVGTLDLSAVDGTGTAATSLRFLSKDNEWIVPAYTSSGIGGSGTLNKMAKFTPDGSNIGNSTMTDDGTDVSITGDFSIGGGKLTTNSVVTFDYSGSGDLVIGDVDGGDEVSKIELKTMASVLVELTDDEYVNKASEVTFENEVNIPLVPTDTTHATSKQYVDGLVSGGLTFKGTFDAASGEILSGSQSGAHIYNCPGGAGTRVAVAVGDYYVVATTGGSFYCSGDTLDIGDSIIGVAASAANLSAASNWSIVQSDEGVTDINSNDGTASTGEAITNNTSATGSVTLDVFEYDGGNNVGYVPSGGSSSTFLRGDGSWVTPGAGALGAKVGLDASNDGIGNQGTPPSGTTGWEIDVSDSALFGSGVDAVDVKIEVIQKESDGGATVYPSVTRANEFITVNFTNLPSAPTAGDYIALLTKVA